jgi:hypothetical protein
MFEQPEVGVATQNQALVTGVLGELKFEPVPQNPPVMGGPQKFTVTDETIKHITSLKGKTLVVGSGGEVTQE